MKKSVEILGLPIISITEGRELGMSKSLLIDAKNGAVAAITIEDDDWYRGVKLLPYESVIAIGHDAVTITNSENILPLEDAGDYENLLDANVRIIGTKAITKSGTIQGKITELFIGDNGKIEKCEISSPDGATTEIAAEQISIFGKQVTVIESDTEKKTESLTPAVEKKETKKAAPKIDHVPETKNETKHEPKSSPKEEHTAEEKSTPSMPMEAAKAEEKPADPAKQLADKATEERHRRFLLGKKAARRITTDNGIVIVDAGADITEEVLQEAKLANKFIELSMNVQ